MRTCPPPDTGRGWGPSIASYREEMTMIAMGGAGVKDVGDIRNEVPKQTISYCCLAMENGGVMDFGVKNELVVSLTRQTVDVCWRTFCEWVSGLSIAS